MRRTAVQRQELVQEWQQALTGCRNRFDAATVRRYDYANDTAGGGVW
jgi:hypothetical protein